MLNNYVYYIHFTVILTHVLASNALFSFFHQDNSCTGLLTHTSIHIKRLQVQVSIPFITKDIAIMRILVIGGGHLEFSQEKVDEKNRKFFFSPLRSI